MSEEYPKTVVQWHGCNGVRYRIQVAPRPGSAHWNILKDGKLPEDNKWHRLTASEATYKPTFTEVSKEE